LQRIWFACDSGDGGDSHARLDFEDSDGDRPLLGLVGTGYWDFREFGGLPPSTDANTNGDINVVFDRVHVTVIRLRRYHNINITICVSISAWW
jgi:hypothetical protein